MSKLDQLEREAPSQYKGASYIMNMCIVQLCRYESDAFFRLVYFRHLQVVRQHLRRQSREFEGGDRSGDCWKKRRRGTLS